MNPCPFRSEARRLGKPTYENGKPCKHGHIAPRNTANATCTVCALAIKAKFRANSQDKIRRSNQKYYAQNREILAETNKAWREQNPERIKAIRIAHYQDNVARYSANSKSRKAAKLMAMPPWADRSKIVSFYRDARRISKETGVLHHVDHIIPLRGANVCGLHVHWNLRVIPALENLQKGNRLK